ncbi:hypothetical protein HPP92_027112 [Vanilla planifolia]|uniref:Uncharacterized protein n=1 Tax=Vanilla planifolia TaxID=51239 RepID=A0A835U6I2_VANPL|nr:hypothetical protein HPP92_027112 [Vanilla planifolia]
METIKATAGVEKEASKDFARRRPATARGKAEETLSWRRVGDKEGCQWCLTLSDGSCYGSKEVVTARWEGVGVGNGDLSAGEGVRRLDDGMEHVCELDGRQAPRRWARRRLPSQRSDTTGG